MEPISVHYSPISQNLFTSPPPLHRITNLRHHDIVGRQPAMKLSPLQRITTALNQPHRKPIQFSLTTTTYHNLRSDLNLNIAMNNSDAKNEIKTADDSSVVVVKDTKETKKPSEIPPPPEKPLPGDCCGSGCVRCVWDVYYEELEDYNKLLKDESDSTTGSKVS
ncbi:hypothetical protein QVD17_25073 [Tagetes erecta]|uniref:Oxidoreductase-like domain-containing protein n=1 Tax=Tagetes erecta TaxID=13708 RepID=A0AAD8KFP8_TARER|nr:hypothetical protein QVD17_25073 [Tagetes erecta]